MTPAENIQDLIPQGPPFIMVDKLLSFSETIISTSFTIRADNIFVENIAQTAAARAGYISKTENKPVAVGYIGAVNNLEVYYLPKPGDELITEIAIKNQIFDVTLISGKIICNGKPVAQCNMKIFINQIKTS